MPLFLILKKYIKYWQKFFFLVKENVFVSVCICNIDYLIHSRFTQSNCGYKNISWYREKIANVFSKHVQCTFLIFPDFPWKKFAVFGFQSRYWWTIVTWRLKYPWAIINSRAYFILYVSKIINKANNVSVARTCLL